MTNVLILGYGNIGKHIYDELKTMNPYIYDPNIPQYNNYPKINIDIAFVCVPTDSQADGSCDTSIVEKTIKKCNAEIIVIKSAIPVGTAEYLEKKHKKRIVVSPEYYGTTQHSDNSPNFLILGGDIKDCVKVAQIYYTIKNGKFRIIYTTSKVAEIAKYMENCFLALKVTFCNEFATVASEYDIPYELLREVFIMDERMGDSHTFVLENQKFYNSHCLNKDIPAFLNIANGKAPLIEKMYEINKESKKNTNYNLN